MSLRHLFVCLWLLCGMMPVMAQQYTIQTNRYGIDEGMNARLLRGIVEDPTGMLWVGSMEGLLKFDGRGFRQVMDKPIYNLVQDDSGVLWASYEDSLYYKKPGSDKLIYDQTYSGKKIEKMSFQKGYLWMADSEKLFRYRPGDEVEEIIAFNKAVNLPGGLLVLELAIESPESIWFTLANVGVLHINEKGTVLSYEPGYPNLVNFRVLSDGNLWREAGGLSYRSAANMPFEALKKSFPDRSFSLSLSGEGASLNAANPRAIVPSHLFDQSDPDQLWFFSLDQSAVYSLHKQSGELTAFDLSIMDFVEANPLFLDSHNVLWILTFEDLVSVKISENPIEQFLSEAPNEASTRAIFQDLTGELLVNSYSGVFSRAKDGKISTWAPRKIYRTDGDVTEGTEHLFFYNALPEEDHIWFTSDSQGLIQYDRSDDMMYQLEMPGFTFANDLLRMPSGDLWIGTAGGIRRVHEETKSITARGPQDSLLTSKWVFDMERDRFSDNVWAATLQGIYKLNLDKVTVVDSYIPPGGDPGVNAIYQDKEGIIWATTPRRGLIRLNTKNDELQFFNKASHGLSDDRLAGILEENDSILWVSSFNGLMRFNKLTHAVQSFFEHDGLTDNEFNHGSAFKAADGKMYFGGIKGVNAFYPDDLVAGEGQNRVLLIDLRKYDTRNRQLKTVTSDVNEAGSLVLSPSDDFITIDFALNDRSNPQSNSFAYKIAELDQEWMDLGRQHSLRLTKPSAGNYTLLIKGRGSNGIWTEPLAIGIDVLIPFYQRTEFVAGSVVALLLLLVAIVRWRTGYLERAKVKLETVIVERTAEISQQKELLEKQAEKLRNLDEAKSRFFANISHELRTPLTLILGHTSQLLESENARDFLVQTGLQTTKKNAEGLLGLIEEIMQLSKLEAGKVMVESRLVKPYQLFSRVADIYATACVGKNITFNFDTDLPKTMAMMLDLSKLEKVLNNLLSNALKFTGEGGAITLKINLADEHLMIAVSDTGRGIHPDDLPHIFKRFYQSERKGAPIEGGTGIGLSLAYELVHLMDGTLNVQSQMGEGSTFICQLPAKGVSLMDTAEQTAEEPRLELVSNTKNREDKTEEQVHNASILLVEDHLEMRSFIKQVLAPHYRVHEAGNGLEALKVLKKHHVDLVVSDYMMPEMDGLQLLTRMKQEKSTRSIAVILLTARSDVEDKLRALTLGVDEYMLKPFNPQELLVRVKNLLAYKAERAKWLLKMAEEESITLSEEDSFMEQVKTAVMDRLSDTSFGVIDLSETMLTSQRSLTRKIKAYSGLSPLQFITEVRLQEARRLLELNDQTTISQVMYAVGFQTGGHFSRTFQKRFGKTPSDYVAGEAVNSW